jgi:protein-disulfide isomerase
MEDISNVSSEEELLQLRNEGKITEDEYEQLRETMLKTAKVDVGPSSQAKAEPVRTSGLAIASLIFSLVGPIGCIPAIICGHLALGKLKKEPRVQGRGLALAGTIIGYAVLVFIVVMIPIFLLWDIRAESVHAKREAARNNLENMRKEIAITELKSLPLAFPLDSTEGVIAQSGVTIDKQISSDGNGSLRIEATEPTTVRLFETGDIDIENARLIYQAQLRTEDVEGQVYLEMWCHFAGVGEAYSRGLMTPLTGTTEWTTEEIPFFLNKGENPDNVKLNLGVTGKGTVWIDDIRLLKGPLQAEVEVTELKHYPLDNIEGVLTQSGVQIDKQISSDGNGSIRIEATEPTTVRLFETGDIDIEDTRLTYQARVRTENVEGQVYLEMWCHFAGVGEAYSRGPMTPLTGTTEWTTEEIPFFLNKGENPDNVKLNVGITGKGTVWIDDIRLIKGALN